MKNSVFYNSVNINHLISIVSGNNDNGYANPDSSTIMPRRSLAYTASFSRKNTIKQVHKLFLLFINFSFL